VATNGLKERMSGVIHSRLCLSAMVRSVEHLDTGRKVKAASNRGLIHNAGGWRAFSPVRSCAVLCDILDHELRQACCVTDEARHSFRHHPAFLRPGTPFYKHGKIQFLGCQTLKRVLADSAELTLIHVFEEPFLRSASPSRPA